MSDATIQMTQAEFDSLLEYSKSMPTGTTIGKRWKRKDSGVWWLGEYTESPYPNRVGVIWREILITPVQQPAPTPNAGAHIVDLVKADLDKRRALGIQKYGTPLQAHNGRDALVDAYEEALDLAQYLRQAIEERGSK